MSRESQAETFTAVFRKDARTRDVHSKALGHLQSLVNDMRRYLDSNLSRESILKLLDARVDDALGVVDAVDTVTAERLAFLEQANASTGTTVGGA